MSLLAVTLSVSFARSLITIVASLIYGHILSKEDLQSDLNVKLNGGRAEAQHLNNNKHK